jgi:RecA-family ATPase
METNYKLLEEAVYINQVEHQVIFMYKDKKVIASGQYYIGSMGFDDLSIEIEEGDNYEDIQTADWKLHKGEISENEYDEIREIAEELIYEMEATYNEEIYHKRYSHETKTI